MRAALSAINREPAVVGAFLWKWFPGDARPRDFEMSSPAIEHVLELSSNIALGKRQQPPELVERA